MKQLTFRHQALAKARVVENPVLVGVVSSGNLEVLVEHAFDDKTCEIDVRTPVTGFDQVWRAVVKDFVERFAPGGLRFSINDGGARPDMVMLRLAQALSAVQGNKP
jgi:malonate decarboxylase delta subunit